MARLHGREAYLEGSNADGVGASSIRISVTGLRPGEKLYEELLVDGWEVPTDHPRVMCEQRALPEAELVEAWLQSLVSYADGESIVELMLQLPLSYCSKAT
jgi:FlaA1/EpsC-like NDP-sugar epimerase